MECFLCKEVSELAVDTPNCKLCVQCYHESDPDSNCGALKNDVLFHIYHNRMRAVVPLLLSSTENKFDPKEIETAKDLLINSAKGKLDPETINAVSISRKKTTTRSKEAALIGDMLTIFDNLEDSIKIKPAYPRKMETLNPQALLPEAIVARLSAVEKQLASHLELLKAQDTKIDNLQKENATLRGELSNSRGPFTLTEISD